MVVRLGCLRNFFSLFLFLNLSGSCKDSVQKSPPPSLDSSPNQILSSSNTQTNSVIGEDSVVEDTALEQVENAPNPVNPAASLDSEKLEDSKNPVSDQDNLQVEQESIDLYLIPLTEESCSERELNWVWENNRCRRKNFLEYCTAKDSTDQAIQHTVSVLMKLGESCSEAWKRLSKQTSLDLSSFDISSIDPLVGFGQFESLVLNHNQIRDISPLVELIGLKVLRLSYNSIKDIRAIAKLSQLEQLDLSQNRFIQTLSPVAAAKNINLLNLSETTAIGADELKVLNKVKIFWFEKNGIDSIDFIKFMPALEVFKAAQNRIVDVTAFASSYSLKQLDLSQNFIQSLQELNLSSTGWSESGGGLLLLEYLNLDGNRLQFIDSLSKMARLKFLSLENNQLKDLSPLSNLIFLETLAVGGNPFIDLDSLSSLSRLRELEMQNCKVQNFDSLSLLSALTKLDIRGCVTRLQYDQIFGQRKVNVYQDD